MSRKVREIKKNFTVFCEGDTEHHYIEEMKRQKRFTIALKTVNMEGGGYSNFLKKLKTDGNTNSLAKFIIIDGDRAISEEGEKKKLRELLEYCILQNNRGRIPHLLIVNFPDFEYISCLHNPDYRGQNVAQFIMKEMGYKDIDAFKADTKIYSVLHKGRSSSDVMLATLNRENCFVVNEFKVNKTKFEIMVKTVYKWEKLGQRGSNINEFFEILNCF